MAAVGPVAGLHTPSGLLAVLVCHWYVKLDAPDHVPWVPAHTAATVGATHTVGGVMFTGGEVVAGPMAMLASSSDPLKNS